MLECIFNSENGTPSLAEIKFSQPDKLILTFTDKTTTNEAIAIYVKSYLDFFLGKQIFLMRNTIY